MKKRLNAEEVVTIALIGGGILWAVLALIKAFGGLQGISWLLLACGVAYIPFALVVLAYLIEVVAWLSRNLSEIQYRLHTYRVLKSSMHGLTLNTIGPLYGVDRIPGEGNKYFEFRILLQAARGGKAFVKKQKPAPKPATGKKLDAVAKKHGLVRQKDESDDHLQDRIREVIMKRLNDQLEGGKA